MAHAWIHVFPKAPLVRTSDPCAAQRPIAAALKAAADSFRGASTVLFGSRSGPQAAAARTVGAFELRAAEMEAKHKREVRHDICERVHARARLHMCVCVCGCGVVRCRRRSR